MNTKPTPPNPQQTSKFRWKLLFGVFASVALYLLGVTYWINSEPAGDGSIGGGESDAAVARAAAEDRNDAIRVRMRKADERILQALVEKDAALRGGTDSKRSRVENLQYVNTYKAQVLDAIDSVGPEGAALVEDLRKRTEDPDFNAEYQ